MLIALVLGLCACQTSPVPAPAAPAATAGLITGDQWLEYFKRDLLPFWMHPDALGEPVGNFPSVRCDDGSKLDRADPCPEIKGNAWLMQNRNYVVSMSRQTYGYGVAFHLTGEVHYLKLMKAGVDYLRANALDKQNGGAFAYWDGEAERWGPEPAYRNPQELAYALLGMAFYAYLTRDADVMADVVKAQQHIFRTYRNKDLNALQWQLADGGDAKATDKKLTAQLDQLNAYMVLLGPLLPEEARAAWQAEMRTLVQIMRDEFYSPDDNLFFLRANTRDEVSTVNAETDFGHTIKAFWMMRFVGLQTGDATMVQFAEENGARVLRRAYVTDTGSWARGVKRGGAIDASKEWWIYNELDQFAATMALNGRLDMAQQYLDKTNAFWFRHFVDAEHGEVWTSVRPDGTRNADMPKAWPWKSAYHSFEHALVGTITARAMGGRPVELYYAFDQTPDARTVQPYFFTGTLGELDVVSIDAGIPVYRATFTDVN